MRREEREGQLRGGKLSRIVSGLALEAARAQLVADEAVDRALESYAARAASAGLQRDPDLLTRLAPPRYRFATHEVEVSLELATERSTGFRLGIEINGELAHAFFHTRFSRRDTEYNRLAITVESVPIVAGDRRPKEEDHDSAEPA